MHHVDGELTTALASRNDAERQDAGMRNAETRSILARSALDARSLRVPNDSASTIRNSVLSAGGDLDRSLGVDEELVRSGPYLSHYREMVSRQRGADGRNRQDADQNRQTVPFILSEETGTSASPKKSPSATSSSSSSGLFGKPRAWKSSHKGRQLVAQLCQASKDGNVRWAELLLKDGADIDGYCLQYPINDSANDDGDGVGFNKTKITPPDRWSIKEKGKATSLVCAVEAGHLEMVKFLLSRGADPNNPDAMEPSALVQAVRGATARKKWVAAKYREMACLLLEHEANAEAPEDLPASFNPLTIAIHQKSHDVADLLLQHGANPNQPRSSESGRTRDWRPLHVAAQLSVDLVGLLLDSGAVAGLTGVHDGVAGVTALHVAKDKDVAQRLISAGASVFAVDGNGQTPLFWAVKAWPRGHERGHSAAELDRIVLIISANLQNGSPVNLRDKKGKTPLALIERTSHSSRVTIALLAAGADPQ